jgi:uroporphyrinogen decarboxylase
MEKTDMTGYMTGKQRMETTLSFREPDHPPHFEVMFELEEEAFGRRFPDRNAWAGMSSREKELAVRECMEIYRLIVDRYQWDALSIYWPWSDPDGIRAAKKEFGDEILIGGMCGHGIWSIEVITDWTAFAVNLIDDPAAVHEEAETMCQRALSTIDTLAEAGADLIYMPNDIAFNANPFVSPLHFEEFIAPYWKRQVDRVKEHGLYAFIHTDGMIMPVLDQLIDLGAHCLQSIDPMAGMDIAEVKRKTYGKLALMGNVQCNLLQDGPKEAIEKSALYALEQGTPGGGYIYSTSNTIFPGMPLENYEFMLDVFHDFNRRRAESQAVRE